MHVLSVLFLLFHAVAFGACHQPSEESLPFLLCDFSAADLCNWQAKEDDDLAEWKPYAWSSEIDGSGEGLPTGLEATSFAYVTVGANQVEEDRQAAMITTIIWPMSSVGCLRFNLWLENSGDQLTVSQVISGGEEKYLYSRNETTGHEWLKVSLDLEMSGSFRFAFDGKLSEKQLEAEFAVSLGQIYFYPYTCEEVTAEKTNINQNVKVRSSLNTVNQAYAGGLWPNKQIPYYIHADTTQAKSFSPAEVDRVRAAIEDLNYHLPKCVQFKPVEYGAVTDYLYIIHDTSRECWSDGIGRLGGTQAIRLNSQCLDKRGAIQRILLHAIGLYNEHDRADRDKYVLVRPENIVYWAQQYFVLPPFDPSETKLPSPNAAVTWGLPYDVASLTHFSEVQYSYDGVRKTLELRDPPGNRAELVGQSEGMSIQDINKIYLLYSCNMADRKLPNVSCTNGGIPSGFDFCICPSLNATASFSGLYCQTAVCHRPCGPINKVNNWRRKNYCIPGEHPGDPNRCSCGGGYTGEYCDNFVCSPPCENEGVCTGPNVCTCREGYSGSRCHNVRCSPACQNGGTCIANAICACPYGFRGPQCQYPTCFQPCLNGGTCSGLNVCTCPSVYAGDRCEISLLSERKDCGYTISNGTTTEAPSTTPGLSFLTQGARSTVECPGTREYCAKLQGCPDVKPEGTCLCEKDFDMVNGTCKRRAFLGEYCNDQYFACYGDSECIDYRCQCNPYKGLVPRNASRISVYYSFCIKAISTLDRNKECFHSKHCRPPMICEGNRCKCPQSHLYFDPVAKTCILHGEFDQKCSVREPGQCKALGPKGSCRSGKCKCTGPRMPYWLNSTEMAIGKVRYVCASQSDIVKEAGGKCSLDPNPKPLICDLKYVCVSCPFTKEERCAVALSVTLPPGILGGSLLEPGSKLLLLAIVVAVIALSNCDENIQQVMTLIGSGAESGSTNMTSSGDNENISAYLLSAGDRTIVNSNNNDDATAASRTDKRITSDNFRLSAVVPHQYKL